MRSAKAEQCKVAIERNVYSIGIETQDNAEKREEGGANVAESGEQIEYGSKFLNRSQDEARHRLK